MLDVVAGRPLWPPLPALTFFFVAGGSAYAFSWNALTRSGMDCSVEPSCDPLSASVALKSVKAFVFASVAASVKGGNDPG